MMGNVNFDVFFYDFCCMANLKKDVIMNGYLYRKVEIYKFLL